MPLDIIGSPENVVAQMRRAIETAIPGAQVDVIAGSPGHFEIKVVAAAFAGRSMVQQQQMVYGAIKDLMAGDHAPVHAIDRLRTAVS
jgi:acid stress-induced BolA-like protein IbaG/YrbA